ncbi:MAG TPA: NADH-quinone oxidoreductase subunit J [Legionellales bacterium]|nr:NADH-quinone oxidoreductase subunit J [Legionellales bacterium]
MREYLFQAIFYLSAALAISGAVAVVLQKNPVRAVLSLVFSFFMVSIIWVMCNAEFLALVLVLVYVGAVMTLFLFVVMMLNIDVEVEQSFPKVVFPIAIALLIAFLGILWSVMPKDLLAKAVEQTAVMTTNSVPNTVAIGQVLYIDYIAPVELTALLLLVAIIASITLVHRGPRNIKRQDVKKQIMVRSKDRVKLVDITPDNKR